MPMQPEAPLQLTDNGRCFVCGKDNPSGLKLQFRRVGNDEIEAEFTADPRFQGFAGLLHGGMTALLLDEVMVNLAWVKGLNAVSAELNVRLKKPVLTGQRVILRGRIAGEDRRIVRTEARALTPSGEVLAEATGTCIKLSHRKETPCRTSTSK